MKSRTPFLFETERARMLIAELEEPDRISDNIGLRHVPNDALPGEVRDWMRACWGRSPDLLRAGEMANRSGLATGKAISFPAIHNTARMLAVKRHLDDVYMDPVRLSDVARSFQLDPFYLSRAFTRTTGIAPKAFAQSLRFEHFLRAVLAHPDRSLTSLAFEAGVPDYYAFCRWLKQRLGAARPRGAVRSSLSKPRSGAGSSLFPMTGWFRSTLALLAVWAIGCGSDDAAAPQGFGGSGGGTGAAGAAGSAGSAGSAGAGATGPSDEQILAASWQVLPNAPQIQGKQDDLYFVTPERGVSVNGLGQLHETTDGETASSSS